MPVKQAWYNVLQMALPAHFHFCNTRNVNKQDVKYDGSRADYQKIVMKLKKEGGCRDKGKSTGAFLIVRTDCDAHNDCLGQFVWE